MEITVNELIGFVMVVGAIVGLILGLIVLYFGVKKENKTLGIVGFFVTFLSGGLFSILVAIIVASVFLYMIMKMPAIEIPSADSSDLENATGTENS